MSPLTARVLISCALLILAGLIIFETPGQEGVNMAAPLITLVAGYWISHGDVAGTGGGLPVKPKD